MTEAELAAIRARTTTKDGMLISELWRRAYEDIPALLAYIDELHDDLTYWMERAE